MSQYRGRKNYRRHGVNPMVLVMLAAIIVAAVIFLVVGIKKEADKPRPPKPEKPPKKVEEVVDDTQEEQAPEESVEPQEETPAPLARIEINGEIEESDTVYRVGDTGYEYYTYVDSTAKKYASCVNQVADDLKGIATVYDMILPLSSGITLPDELYGTSGLDDQKSAEEKAYGYMNENVVTVPLYDAMMAHRSEYIYFRTDHHWTATGAYYAYCELCKAMGITPHELSEYDTWEFPGFLGSFYGFNKKLGTNPDTVTAYLPISSGVSMNLVVKEGGAVKSYEGTGILYDETGAPAENLYGTFLWGDNEINGINLITNSSDSSGRSCVLVKESFGNAFAPFLPDHYSKVYVLDYRYWKGSLTSFVKQNHVDDVIFCNNLGAATRGSLVGDLHGIL